MTMLVIIKMKVQGRQRKQTALPSEVSYILLCYKSMNMACPAVLVQVNELLPPATKSKVLDMDLHGLENIALIILFVRNNEISIFFYETILQYCIISMYSNSKYKK